MQSAPFAPLLALPLLLTACDTPPSAMDTRNLPEAFLVAEAETGVPAELLVGIARAETRFDMIVSDPEFEGQEVAYGWMAIRDSSVARAAALSGRSEWNVRYAIEANVVGTAWLLAEEADRLAIDTADLGAWAPVVAWYSGIEDASASASYVHHEVYRPIQEGLTFLGHRLRATPVVVDYPTPENYGQRGSWYEDSIWTPSPNYSSRGGVSPDYIVIHTCEGSYSGCWSWLSTSGSGVSAHYVVNDSGSEVRQLVEEGNRAWHVGANYDCGNNGGVDCDNNGWSMNTLSVGIEHAGYSSQSSWDPGLIERSAELACDVAQRHGIPRDSYHIIGHGQIQPWNRTDPGPNWPWADYIRQVQEACGDIPAGGDSTPPDEGDSGSGGESSGTATQFVIDSNDTYNGPDTYVEVSESWWGSVSVPGFYNSGYWAAPTAAVADPARFHFYEAAAECYRVEAWWPAASNRPTAIDWVALDAQSDEVGRATVNQRINGSQWNTLGTWQFSAGWNQILLSRWANSGDFAVADAVRLTPSSDCP